MNIGSLYKHKTKIIKCCESGIEGFKGSSATITIQTLKPRVVRKAWLEAVGPNATAIDVLDHEALKRRYAEYDAYCQTLFPLSVTDWSGFYEDAKGKKSLPCTGEGKEALLDVCPALAGWVNDERTQLEAGAEAEARAEAGN